MNNVAAAIGLANLPHMPDLLARHRQNAAIYDELLMKSNKIKPIKRPENCSPAFWVYTVVLQDATIDRDALCQALGAEGIHAGQVHVPNDDYACFAVYRRSLPGLRDFSSRQLSLPCGWWLSIEDVRFIGEKLLALL